MAKDLLSPSLFPYFFQVDKARVEVHADRGELGKAAGEAAAVAIKKAIAEKGAARVIFAAAPSQNETLATLASHKEIEWNKVTALHMDEYIGLPRDSKARFSQYLKDHLFDLLPFKEVYLLDDPALGLSTEEIIARYKDVLAQGPVDVVCMGIGENGHIAFNDPGEADFNDPEPLKIVDLDDKCRNQQVNDGCFPNFDAVPKQAITLTIPTLMSAGTLVCAVPGELKRKAVLQSLVGPITDGCPASVLRRHSNATFYVEKNSCHIEM